MKNKNINNEAHIASKIRKNEQTMPNINDYNLPVPETEEPEKIENNSEQNDNITDNIQSEPSYESDNIEPIKDNSKENKGLFGLFNFSTKNKGVTKNILGNNFKMKLIIAGCVIFMIALLIFILLLPSFGGILDITENSDVNFPSKDDITNINGNFNAGVNGNLLTNSLISTIGEENYNKLNNSVKESIQSVGFCTKAASAAAASSLIEGLQSHNFRIPYYWGGGHEDGIYLGVDPNLGGAAGESCSDTTCYYKKGYDCSGFVSWAVSNAINRVVTYNTTAFMGISTPISFSEASAGDILVHENHVVLVIQNNGNSLLTAESAGGGVGTVFRTYDQNAIAAAGLQIKSMSSYFDSVC